MWILGNAIPVIRLFDVFGFEHNLSKGIFWISQMSLQDICSLPHLFYPGMTLRCTVTKLDTTKGGSLSIQLSINPKLVNKALTTNTLDAGMVINHWASCEIIFSWRFSTFFIHVLKNQVLSGCVESVEDHGYIVDLGIKGTNAFLPKSDNPNNREGKRECFKSSVMYRWCHRWLI